MDRKWQHQLLYDRLRDRRWWLEARPDKKIDLHMAVCLTFGGGAGEALLRLQGGC